MMEHEAWTEAQLTYLHSNWERQSDRELAEVLGRSWHSVRHKRCDLGLIRYANKKKPLLQEDNYGPCPAEDEYYSNAWAEQLRLQIEKRKHTHGTYKEKRPCLQCKQHPCRCPSVISPLQVRWT